MPLTECRRAEAILAEDFGVVLGVVGAPALITRETGRDLHHGTHVDPVVIAPGEQGSPGGRAQRCGVELVKAQAVFCQLRKGRRLDRATEGLCGTKANVVDQYDDHIGRAFRRRNIKRRRRRHITRIQLRDRCGYRWLDGQRCAIQRIALRDCATLAAHHECKDATER